MQILRVVTSRQYYRVSLRFQDCGAESLLTRVTCLCRYKSRIPLVVLGLRFSRLELIVKLQLSGISRID
jgi:hypothetical protein